MIRWGCGGILFTVGIALASLGVFALLFPGPEITQQADPSRSFDMHIFWLAVVWLLGYLGWIFIKLGYQVFEDGQLFKYED